MAGVSVKEQIVGVYVKAQIEVKLGKAEQNPSKIYGKMTAGTDGDIMIIFQKKSPDEAVEVHIGEDFKLEKNEIVVHDQSFDVKAKLYDDDKEFCPGPYIMLDGTATFYVLEGNKTKTIAGKHGSINIKKLKTRVIRKDVNIEWNEDLTLSISDPNAAIKLTVYDHDTFNMDDKMGDAKFEIKSFVEALRMNLQGLPAGAVITKVQPSSKNYLVEESSVTWNEGKVVQDMCLRLRNVECGEVELQLHWIDLPSCKGL